MNETLPVLTDFLVPGNMIADQEMKRISPIRKYDGVPGWISVSSSDPLSYSQEP